MGMIGSLTPTPRASRRAPHRLVADFSGELKRLLAANGCQLRAIRTKSTRARRNPGQNTLH